ncbi:MAG TPA: hypothetical protein DCR70_09620, partial [Phycisphaerales bacterium]|nr:hypothetical protein [Phycisphaerales bacterium]
MSSEISFGACVAIAGMHRSGTSLIASMLGDAGVDLGRNFIPANLHNQRGYFEDRRVVDLHDAILAANGTDWALTDAPHTLSVPGDLCDRARELICERVNEARRRSSIDPAMGTPEASAWGWKDPRTTLFL